MFHSRKLWRLLKLNKHLLRQNAHTRAATWPESPAKRKKSDPQSSFEQLLEKHKKQLMFNSHLDGEKLKMGYAKYYLTSTIRAVNQQNKEHIAKKLPPLPLSLQYLVKKDQLLEQETEIKSEPITDSVFHLPYANETLVKLHDDIKHDEKDKEFDRSNIDQWMTNYDHFDDSILDTSAASRNSTEEHDDSDDEGVNLEWTKKYGTPDPNSKISNVACGGCGALLHCNDTAIPGYLPSQIFRQRSIAELRETECQRCHFLKEYNIALNINVHPDEYVKLLQTIRHRKALVVLMVDLLDLPCSIWPGIVDIIGTQRPLIIVGNKVDLLPGDSKGYLKHIEATLMNEVDKTSLRDANIKAVSLISAKTGYGVEELISAMFKVWLCKGDVFLVGCTNVGKSSLFNALMQSDYCKVQAVDLVKRATVSRWPGTTLNLLKFPINRSSGWKIYHRNQRLKADAKLLKAESQLRKLQAEGENISSMPTLIGHIGRSFTDPERMEELGDPFSYGGGAYGSKPSIGINEKDKLYANSKWLYDTPGVVHPDNILSLLTAEELLAAVPKQLIYPQSYYLYPGSTLFIGGLARFDFVECSMPCRFTVFCSENLPVTITKTDDAEELYREFLGTELFVAPAGSEKRLEQWPGLQKHTEAFEFTGEGSHLCCGDVVLSSAGWVSVSIQRGVSCSVLAWTPQGRGIYVRETALLRHAIMLKGKRFQDTPAYAIGKPFIDTHKFKKK